MKLARQLNQLVLVIFVVAACGERNTTATDELTLATSNQAKETVAAPATANPAPPASSATTSVTPTTASTTATTRTSVPSTEALTQLVQLDELDCGAKRVRQGVVYFLLFNVSGTVTNIGEAPIEDLKVDMVITSKSGQSVLPFIGGEPNRQAASPARVEPGHSATFTFPQISDPFEASQDGVAAGCGVLLHECGDGECTPLDARRDN